MRLTFTNRGVLWSPLGAPAEAVQMNRRRLLVILGAGVMAACGLLTFAATRTERADAAVSCQAHQNTAEELQFIGLLQSWRDQNIPGSFPLTRSISLNKAAGYYANFLANNAGAAGHFADGNDWVGRAQQCGYPVPAGGEGLAVVEASQPVSVSASQALSIMASEGGGGIHIPSNVGADVKCVGAAKAVSSDGRKVAWVTLLFATWTGCADPDTSGSPPAASSSTATPTSSSTATSTATATPTKTPTPTPTATPTPVANYGISLSICAGWNLVTMPVAGPVDDMFDTARQDVAAIYLQNGETWLRWAPGVPAYARNLNQVSSGDVLWIYRSEPSCEDLGL
jgi:hypothetical protein